MQNNGTPKGTVDGRWSDSGKGVRWFEVDSGKGRLMSWQRWLIPGGSGFQVDVWPLSMLRKEL
jgi:hypothetical protein